MTPPAKPDLSDIPDLSRPTIPSPSVTFPEDHDRIGLLVEEVARLHQRLDEYEGLVTSRWPAWLGRLTFRGGRGA